MVIREGLFVIMRGAFACLRRLLVAAVWCHFESFTLFFTVGRRRGWKLKWLKPSNFVIILSILMRLVDLLCNFSLCLFYFYLYTKINILMVKKLIFWLIKRK